MSINTLLKANPGNAWKWDTHYHNVPSNVRQIQSLGFLGFDSVPMILFAMGMSSLRGSAAAAAEVEALGPRLPSFVSTAGARSQSASGATCWWQHTADACPDRTDVSPVPALHRFVVGSYTSTMSRNDVPSQPPGKLSFVTIWP